MGFELQIWKNIEKWISSSSILKYFKIHVFSLINQLR